MISVSVAPCVRCLSQKYKRIRSGIGKLYHTIQCEDCGFNVTSWVSFDDAIEQWNGFAVWKLIEKLYCE